MLELAKTIAFNMKAEAQANEDYSELLKFIESKIAENPQESEKLNKYANIVREIMSDENTHNIQLLEMFTEITNTQVKEN